MQFDFIIFSRDLRPASLEKGQELLRLRFYAAYAWGGPLIVAGLAAFLDHLPQKPEDTFLRPRFGEKQCWFYGRWSNTIIFAVLCKTRTFCLVSYSLQALELIKIPVEYYDKLVRNLRFLNSLI